MIEVFKYSSYFEARNKAIVAMLSDCGLRAMEIRQLRTENVKDTNILVNGITVRGIRRDIYLLALL